METHESDPYQELREKTDKSLEDERDKTDEYLDKKNKAVEKDTSDTISLNRLAADIDRESQRADVDLDTEHRRDEGGNQAPQLDETSLLQERERSDKALQQERKQEDRARIKERFQRRLIAEALLEKIRKETDRNLLDERVSIDLESEHNSSLLSGEQTSHHLTKVALLTRDQYLAIVSHDLQNPLVAISIVQPLHAPRLHLP